MGRVSAIGLTAGTGSVTGLQIPATASGPWPAPAKLNLFLHITGRREDGYHTLQTVFQFLDRVDRLCFDITADRTIRRFGGPAGVPATADLCVRAARRLQVISGTSKGVDIYNDKCVPPGGGLGGGSSDAATTLWALNRLWDTGLNAGELARLGLELGADIPVFLHGEAAWAEGIGEILTSLTLPEPWFLVVVPPVSVSTANIFSAAELTRDTPQLTIRAFLSGAGHNDCEAVVRHRYPQVAAALDWLNSHAPARLTGTGACVFAAFESEPEARSVERQVPPDWTAFVARGMNRSPLQAVMT